MIQNGNFDYDDSNQNDPDLAAHFTVAKKRGVSLFGPTTEQMLGDVDWEDYLESVVWDLELILADRYILNSPLYGVLNCCRFLEMLEKGEGTVSSKEEGALWALATLPLEYHATIRRAIECYQSDLPVSVEQLGRAGIHWPEDQLFKFRDYVRKAKTRFFD